MTTHNVITTPAAVKALREHAEAALDAGRLQDAHHVIGDLASEHVISGRAFGSQMSGGAGVTALISRDSLERQTGLAAP
ncbi:MAG: hypothetical protein ABW128_07165 [Rhizorhabdus sp.]